MAIIGASNSLGGLAGSNAIARLLVVISGTSSPLEASLAKAQSSVLSFSEKTSALGSALTRSLTLPLLAVGGAAVMMASQYQMSLAKIQGLTPLLDQMEGGLAEVDSRLQAIADDPQVSATLNDLAHSLYFAGSAGLTANEAFDVVKLSAQAMTVQLGDAADVSKVLIFALNNYRSDGLTAAAAMDTLTAAIKEGTAEPDELAIALGRLLPIAQQAGIMFDEVVASVAALTNLGVPTRVATTSLRALFGQLLSGTKQSKEELNALGITADQLRYKLQQGPLEAFELITDATNQNADSTKLLIPQIRALTAYYGLTGSKLERYKEIIHSTTNAQGAFKTALDAITQTSAFKFQKALQELNTAGVELGSTLLPVFNQVVEYIGNIAKAFQDLPSPVKTAVAALMTVGVIAGPMLKLVGTMTAVREATLQAGAAGTTMVPTWKAVGTSLLVAGLAATVALGSFKSLAAGSTDVMTIATTFISTLITLKLALSGIQTAANMGAMGTNAFALALAGMGPAVLTGIAAGLAVLAVGIGMMAARAAKARQEIEAMGDAFLGAMQSGQSFRQFLDSIEDNHIEEVVRGWAELARVMNTPASMAGPQVLAEANKQISTMFTTLANAPLTNDATTRLGMTADEFKRLAAAAAAGTKAGENWGDAVRAAGGDADKLYEAVNLVHDTMLTTDEAALQNAGTLTDDLLPAYNEMQDAMTKYDTGMKASIGWTTANEQAVQDYAKAHGVSVDYINRGLQEYGVTLAGASEDTIRAWEEAYMGIDENGNLISAKAAEVAAAVEQMGIDMADSLSGVIGTFDEMEKGTRLSINKAISNYSEWRDEALDVVTAIETLRKRGVPEGLITEMLGTPGLASGFATATNRDLQKVVDLYAVKMAAIDATVLAEGAHQEIKGKNMVEGFAIAMLSAKKLPEAAEKEIVNLVIQAVRNGDLKPAAFDLVAGFTQAMDNMKGVAGNEAAAAVKALINELRQPSSYNKQGQLIVANVAAGIAANSHLTKAQAAQLVRDMLGIVKSKKEEAKSAGSQLATDVVAGFKNGDYHRAGTQAGLALADGLSAAAFGVYRAAANLGNEARQGFHEGLKNSPKYASYYMGIEYAKQFGEGMRTQGVDTMMNLGRPNVPDGPWRRTRSNGTTAHTTVVVKPPTVDRVALARQMDTVIQTKGW